MLSSKVTVGVGPRPISLGWARSGGREVILGAGRGYTGAPVLHPRICAGLTAVSCLGHVLLAASGHHGLWFGILMVVLAAICIPCTVHIWHHSRVGALHRVTCSALAMVVLHTVLLLGARGFSHAHTGQRTPDVADASGAGGLLLVISLEIATALVSATLVARLRRHVRLQEDLKPREFA